MTNTAVHEPILRAAEATQRAKGVFAAASDWITTHWLQVLVATAIATAIVFALHTARGLARRWCARHEDGNDWRAIVTRALTLTNGFFIVMLAAKLVGSTFASVAPPREVARTIDFLWIVAAVFQVAVWAREIILGAVEYRTRADHYHGEALTSAMSLIRLLVTFAVFAIALVVVLDNLGVNVTGLIAGFGVGGIAIGLAAQGIFADLFAALSIIFDRPFRRGDTIAYDQTTGTVETIGLKSTRIRSATGEERIISNKNLLDKEIQNITRRDYRRATFRLGVVQWTSEDKLAALPDLARKAVEAEGGQFGRAGFLGFGASSYDFDVEFDSPTADYDAFFDARHRIGMALIRRLNAEGIALAYPTQTQVNAPVDAAGRLRPDAAAVTASAT